jgi:hypothetical protein
MQPRSTSSLRESCSCVLGFRVVGLSGASIVRCCVQISTSAILLGCAATYSMFRMSCI